jgi:hypothetical protein
LATCVAVLVASTVALACIAVRVRISGHPAFVRAVVKFTDGTIASNQVEAIDPQPFDGRATVQVARIGVRTQASAQSRLGLNVRVIQGDNRLEIELRAPRRRFKYVSYQLLGGKYLAIALWKSAPPRTTAAEVHRGSHGCLTVASRRGDDGTVIASGRDRNMFEHQFQVVLRGADGRVLAQRSVHAAPGRWRARLDYHSTHWQAGTLEAVGLSAKDGSLACLAQVLVGLPAATGAPHRH